MRLSSRRLWTKALEALRGIAVLELGQQRHQFVDAAIGLLRAGFEQIEKFFVLPQQLANREHESIMQC